MGSIKPTASFTTDSSIHQTKLGTYRRESETINHENAKTISFNFSGRQCFSGSEN